MQPVKKVGIWLLMVAILIGISSGISCSTKASQTEVRMGYLNGAIGDLAFFVAQEKGMFPENGVDLKMAVPFNSGTPMMDALAANQLDMGYVGISPAVIASARNVDLSIVAGVVQEYDALIVDKSINSLADLRGKKIATPAPGSVQYIMISLILDKSNLSFNDLQILPGTINPPDMAGALATGNINGYIAWEPFLTQGLVAGSGKVLIESKDIWPGGMMGGVIVTRKDFAQKNPQAVLDVIKAHKQANEFIKENTTEAKAIAVKYTKLDAKVIETSWPHNIYDYSINKDSVKTFADQIISLGESGAMKPIISRSDIPDMDAFLNKTIDSSYLSK